MTLLKSNRRLIASMIEDAGELVARHDAPAERDYTELADAPTGFVRDVLKGEPWEAQEDIAEAVRDHPLTVVRSCNSAGKDWLAGRLALWWVYAKGGLALVTGPTQRQVQEIVMGEVAKAFHRARDLPGELYQMALRMGREEDRGILAFTSSEASRLTGHHAPRVLVIITEGQGVDDFAYEGLLSCATGDEDRVLVLGNPLAPTGRFFEISHAPHWESIRISAEDHPNVQEGKTVIPGGVTRRFIETIEKEYGAESNTYRSRVLGEFPDQGEEALFARSWLDLAAQKLVSGAIPSDPKDVVVAVDPARYGPDSTVLAVRRGKALEGFDTWSETSTTESVQRIRRHLFGVGIIPFDQNGRIVVDEIGVGGGIVDGLRGEGFRVEGFNAGRKASSSRFLNRRAESYWGLRKLLENGKVGLPPDEDLFEELLATNWAPTSTGKIQIEAKEKLKDRLGRSPDKADAVVMAFNAGIRAYSTHFPLI